MSETRPHTIKRAVAHARPPEADGLLERHLGRYRLCFEIATGGMATVYLARAEGPAGFEKVVALKCIHPHLAKSPAFVDMFLDEARIASRIAHANVCSVFDFGEADGTYYLAMEYLVGEPLSRVLRVLGRRPDLARSSRAWALAARIVADACEGLHAAHELRDARGRPLEVVHRDVSPENLFVTYDGTVRIVDFGIATARNKLHETRVGDVKGKVAYMAPEQLRSERVDRRVDVWALGIVLWETIAGRRLFRRAGEAQTVDAVMRDEVPSLRTIVEDDVWAELDAIVRRAIARDPGSRYPTARDLGRDLVRVLARQPVGPADVAELMEALFSGERDVKLELVDVAKQATGGADTSSMAGAVTTTRQRRRKRAAALVAVSGVIVAAMIPAALLGLGALDGGTPGARSALGRPEHAVTSRAPATSTASTRPESEAAARAAPEPAPAGPVSTKKGSRRRPRGTVVLVTSGGWAQVYDGSRRLGTTPLTTELASGVRTLELRPFGKQPSRTVRVRVAPNERRQISIDLAARAPD